MTDAVLSVDVSLDQLDVALRTDDTGWQWPHRPYPNNWPGYQQLKAELLVELGQAEASRLTAVAESTGPYWWPAFHQLAHDVELADYQLQLAVLNPQHVKRFRKALPEQDKNDLLDPQLIDRYYQAVGVKHYYQFNDRYLPLRFLTRAYARLIHALAAEKAYLRSLLFLLASDYQRVEPFSDLCGATSLQVLDEFDDIQALAAIPLAELADQLRLWSGNHLSDPAHQAQQLHQVADHSYPLPPALAASLHAIVQCAIAHIRFLSDRFARKRCVVSLNNNCSSCLGPLLVAGCLSEIQDTTRFISGTKFDRKLKRLRPRTYRDGQAAVAKLAGLWWPQADSGRFQAEDRHLARERNPYLRYWLVQAAYTLQRYQPDYAAFYWRKFYQVRAHQHKRALILTARKAVRLIFALLHKGQRTCLQEEPVT